MREPQRTDDDRFEGLHVTLLIQRRAPGVLVIAIKGVDTGELGDAPFRALEGDMAGSQPIELFVDARDTRGASVSVSSEWAVWLARHKHRFRHISMLTGSRFIKLTADFVRRFAELGDLMRIYTDPAAFDGALSNAIGNAAPVYV
jgi:hypothetical protein